jgi:hypothetical protein
MDQIIPAISYSLNNNNNNKNINHTNTIATNSTTLAFFLSMNSQIESNPTFLSNHLSINNNNNESNIGQIGSLIFASTFALIFVIGIIANLLVIAVFILKNEFRQFTNYFFVNLSIADILIVLICIPVAISDLLSPDEWIWGHLYCQIYHFIEYCVTSVSSFTIITISFERYYAITKPLSVFF